MTLVTSILVTSILGTSILVTSILDFLTFLEIVLGFPNLRNLT